MRLPKVVDRLFSIFQGDVDFLYGGSSEVVEFRIEHWPVLPLPSAVVFRHMTCNDAMQCHILCMYQIDSLWSPMLRRRHALQTRLQNSRPELMHDIFQYYQVAARIFLVLSQRPLVLSQRPQLLFSSLP